VRGITANESRIKELFDRSIVLVTALNPYIGYQYATEVAQEALLTGKRVYDIVLERGLLTAEKLDDILKPESMTTPRLPLR
jgi:aspartate ammonia-lyase